MIREASVNDIDGIVHVINESNYRAYQSIIPKEHFRHPIASRNTILRDMGRMRFYVYEVGDRVVGVAALQPEPRENLGIVRWVYVHPRHQRRGIGTALMKHVEKEARGLGLERLRLVTHDKASWAITFYEKLGFKAIGYVQRTAWRDIVMEKAL